MTELRIGSGTYRVVRSDADCLELEATYAPHGSPPPRHLHPGHDEHFEIRSGALKVDLGQGAVDVRAGESFDVPRGTPHLMWNPGDEPAEVVWRNTPALRCEAYFRGLAELHEEAARRGHPSPDPLALAAHAQRYRELFQLVTAGSPLLGRAVISVLGTLGRLAERVRPTTSRAHD